jgi:cation transport ATPase
MTHSYNITGITCNNCVTKIKSELLKLGDVTGAEVQIAAPQATISMQKHVPTGILQQAISKAGAKYQITEAGGMLHGTTVAEEAEANSYLPIFLIFGYITGVTLLVQFASGSFNGMEWMSHFMAGFFLVFSFFKLMDLKGFAEGYSSYDIVAKKIPAYGYYW